MTHEALALLALIQTAAIGVLIVALAARRLVFNFSMRRFERRCAATRLGVQRWLQREIDDAALAKQLSVCDLDVIDTVSHQLGGALAGARWEELVELLRASNWFGRAIAQSRSRLWWRRVEAARALALVGRPDDREPIRALVLDRNHRVRMVAVDILRRVADADLVGALIEELAGADALVRRYVFAAIREQGPELSGLLADKLSASASPEQTCCLLELMSTIADPCFLTVALACADHDDARVRMATARVLAELPHPRSAQALMRMLDDAEARVRESAADALATLGAVEAAEALQRKIGDPDERVRMRAALSLRRLGPTGCRILEKLANASDAGAELSRYVMGLDSFALTQLVGADPGV